MENDILIDFRFAKEKPRFGELFLITGEEHPKFPPRNKNFAALAPLGFEQLDDFFGILNSEDTGDDVLVWLFPMLNGEEVFHNSGPFDAIRLSYSALRNAPANIALLQECFNAIKGMPDVEVQFEDNTIRDFAPIQQKADEIVAYWRENDIEPGSEQSLLVEEEEDEDWEDDDWDENDDWEEEEDAGNKKEK
ncbi:hypothetical protein HGH93_02990 [Chitinophaga polysaccharea]|uniref:hypothetical protein n=1 Tax=Chitinophaga TaxID=79328 RepID=UPI001455D5F3|nr:MULTISPECIES: hypothetical protein [Chitinophaga]NLR57047.1 hypothetical protein [Chitinophaga polysaccharea]NLU91828.1 hypothetical protein [Chitinophaga sp. Ak27]